MTTYDDTVRDRYVQEYTEPDLTAPRSTGYISDGPCEHFNRRSRFDEVLESLLKARSSISAEQLRAIEAALSGGKQQDKD